MGGKNCHMTKHRNFSVPCHASYYTECLCVAQGNQFFSTVKVATCDNFAVENFAVEHEGGAKKEDYFLRDRFEF